MTARRPGIAHISASLAAIASLLSSCGTTAARETPKRVRLDVSFRLTDLDYKPITGETVRIVLGSGSGWQGGSAGTTVVTDANGAARLQTDATLDMRMRKVPTNFVGSLLATPQATRHVQVAVELPYMTFRWLYAIDICRFPNGDVMLDGFSVYTRDDGGAFTRKAAESADGWRMQDLSGLVLTMPGYQPWDYLLEPDGSETSQTRWTLRFAAKRYPPPVRR